MEMGGTVRGTRTTVPGKRFRDNHEMVPEAVVVEPVFATESFDRFAPADTPAKNSTPIAPQQPWFDGLETDAALRAHCSVERTSSAVSF